MREQANPLLRSVAVALAGISARARWSFVDQVLVSGANFLTVVLLLRTLGAFEFGVYSLVMICVQFVASVQGAAIIAPMMTMFDQRGDVSRSRYLGAVVLHHFVFAAIVAMIAVLMSAFAAFMPSEMAAINFGLVAALTIGVQSQDLVRRFLYVTERPALAFLSDLVAYGARLAVIAAFALSGHVTVEIVWVVILATSVAALVFALPDLVGIDFSRAEIADVTRAHGKIAGWLVGNSVVGWFSESNFALFLIGSIIGPVQLASVRAVESLVLVVNLLLQSLENFVPSAASKNLVQGGGRAMLRYVAAISLLGVLAILAIVVVLALTLDPVMLLIYGRTFPNQLVVLVILGTYLTLGHCMMVMTAGLRALEHLRAAFLGRVVVGAISIALTWYAAVTGGVVGALSALLVARLALAGLLAFLLWRNASIVPPQQANRFSKAAENALDAAN